MLHATCAVRTLTPQVLTCWEGPHGQWGQSSLRGGRQSVTCLSRPRTAGGAEDAADAEELAASLCQVWAESSALCPSQWTSWCGSLRGAEPESHLSTTSDAAR